ncbi:hypothetical protein C8E01_101464 [Pontibacter virosus]|uniref:Uncharacterized protein n=1 Tax=Pontibacter virosus TaxID=1765052 RepID=A0A2U1B611_9BACT|nr:hypothetical protein C8E01_101464 [Pontibacter virosus]
MRIADRLGYFGSRLVKRQPTGNGGLPFFVTKLYTDKHQARAPVHKTRCCAIPDCSPFELQPPAAPVLCFRYRWTLKEKICITRKKRDDMSGTNAHIVRTHATKWGSRTFAAVGKNPDLL